MGGCGTGLGMVGVSGTRGGCGVQEVLGGVCRNVGREADLGMQGRMERAMSGDEGSPAHERMGVCGTGMGMGESRDLGGFCGSGCEWGWRTWGSGGWGAEALGWGWWMSAGPGVCCGVQGTGDVCGTPAKDADLGVQRRMERVVSGDESHPGAQEGMESYGTGMGMGDSRDLWVL